jgi:hypothetical protein
MADSAPSLAEPAEADLQSSGSTDDGARDLGSVLVAAARRDGTPVTVVRSVGPVGAVVVSGLSQLEDHRVVVAAIRAHLGR